MEIRAYDYLPEEAKRIREDVFVTEQGFDDEFDEIDGRAAHLIAYVNGIAAGTCRIFAGSEPGEFILGRLAVLKDQRGSGLGAALIAGAEGEARRRGGRVIRLHSQLQAEPFYKKQGYTPYGDVEPEQGRPHIWMEKKI